MSALVLVAILVAPFAWLVMDEQRAMVREVVEQVTRNTPDGAVGAYVSALSDKDETRALARWALPPNPPDVLVARRAALTHQLLGTGGHQVRQTEWWSTCCMPSIAPPEYAQYAGFARLTVDLDGAPYVFDVLVAGHFSRSNDSGAPRTWVIRDIYAAGEQPLFWTWPGR